MQQRPHRPIDHAPRTVPGSILALLILSLTAVGCADGGVQQDEILWDEWGVPHIYATTDAALFRGIGWSQAQAHGELILRLYGQARGRAAEYWGEQYLDSDRLVRLMDIPGTAQEWVRDQPGRFQPLLDAFVAGFNAYMEANPESVPAPMRRVLPVTAEDVAAHTLRTIHHSWMAYTEGLVGAARQSLQRGAGTAMTDRPQPRPPGLEPRAPALGSNAWAIGPARSASGNALLVANPHVPYSDRFLFFEIHAVTPDLAATGATAVGIPFIAIGFNDRLGWTHTVNPHDGEDLFRVEVDGDGYRFGDETREFERRTEEILVRDEGGEMRTDTMVVQSTVHGPVLAADGEHAIAARVVGTDASDLFDQYWGMIQAQNLQEFEAEVSRLQMPMFNVIYADADGRIMYLYNGRVPVRDSGGVARWAGVVDGSDPSTLWDEVLPYERLPKVVDPATGWVHNSNDPPWTSTLPRAVHRDDYPPYLAPSGMGLRPQRSARMLMADSSITFQELLEYKHSTRMLLADRILDDLLPLATASEDEAVRRAGEALETWDRMAETDSRGATLFVAWVREWLGGGGSFAEPWDPERPTTTPDGIADPDAALAALAAAAEMMQARHGSLTVPYGDVHRLRFGEHDVAGNGASAGVVGVFRVATYEPREDGPAVAVHGDSYVALIEFTPDGPRGRELLTYGNWTREGSPHVGDQTELFGQKRLRPILWDRADVEAATTRREGIPGG